MAEHKLTPRLDSPTNGSPGGVMNTYVYYLIAHQRGVELRRAAERARFASEVSGRRRNVRDPAPIWRPRPGFRRTGLSILARRNRAAARRSRRLRDGDRADIGAGPSVQVPARPVRGSVSAPRSVRAAGSEGHRGCSHDLSDVRSGPSPGRSRKGCLRRSTSARSSTRPRSWW